MTIKHPETTRGWPLRLTQRLRKGELVTMLVATSPSGQEIQAGYRGALTASGIAMMLRVLARRVEAASAEIV